MSEENNGAAATKTETQKDDTQALREELDQLRKEKSQWSSQNTTLNDKVKMDQEERLKRDSDSKSLESALTFNLTSADFLKANDSVLPKEISEIFQMASKEKYENAIQKASATKAAIIQSFFSQQSNVDFLTDSQKLSLADYLKLTKNGKEEKAREIYDNLFEPSLAALKRVKKAEEIFKSKQGFGLSTNSDQSYKDKLSKMAEKKLFRGKNA